MTEDNGALGGSVHRGRSAGDFHFDRNDLVSAFRVSRFLVWSSASLVSAVLAVAWGWRGGWLVAALSLPLSIDAWLRLHRRSDAAFMILLLIDVTASGAALLAADFSDAIVIAPFVYLLVAAVLVLSRRDGVRVAGYIAAWLLVILFTDPSIFDSGLSPGQQRTAIALSSLINIGAVFVLISLAASGVRERQSLDLRLRRSTAQLATVVSGAPVVLFSIDSDGIFTLSEGAGLALLGLKPGEVVGLSAWDVYADYPAILDFIRDTLAGNETVDLVVDLPTASFQMRVSPQRDSSGEVVSIIGVGYDVTDQIAAERELHRMQAVDQLLAVMSVEMIALPTDGHEQSIERQLGRIAIHLAGESACIVSRPEGAETEAFCWHQPDAADLVDAGLLDQPLPWLEGVMRRQSVFSIADTRELPPDAGAEAEFFAEAGLTSILAVPLTPRGPAFGYAILGTQGHSRQWSGEEIMTLRRGVGMLSNVLGRLRAQHRLEELVRSKDQFVASVSHELRTPLASVVGLSEILRDAPDDFSAIEVGEFHSILAEQSGELAAIVEDLLVIARADIDAVTMAEESVVLTDEAEFVAVSMPGSERGRIYVPEEQVEAWCDRGRLRQVLRNLMSNALRYGGPDIWLRLRYEDDCSVVEVCDNGDEIAADDVERIFQPYERAGSEPGKPGSIGLGLTVSRKLCWLMGGDLSYERGEHMNVFRVTLPSTMVPAIRTESPGSASIGET